MANGIIITGPSGAGKTTLGKMVADALGFKFVDLDDYIWRKDTEIPFSVTYSREEKISGVKGAISDCEHFVMAGSMDSFHEHFDPFFTLAVMLHADAETRVERVHKRKLLENGERILEGGDMFERHQSLLENIAGYDYGKGSTTLQTHEKWLNSLSCKVIRLDGALPLEENLKAIIKEYEGL